MSSRWSGTLLAAAVLLVASAHVGSPDTVFEGAAGPYRVRVIVRPPGIVPGQAEITVRLLAGSGLQSVLVLPLRGGRSTAEDPPPDTAKPVPGARDLYSAQLWLMEGGAYSIQVAVRGAAGSGSVIVPVNSIATRRLGFDTPLAIALLGLGAFLFVGAITIVGAAVRESVLVPGTEPDAGRRRRSWWIRLLAVPLPTRARFAPRCRRCRRDATACMPMSCTRADSHRRCSTRSMCPRARISGGHSTPTIPGGAVGYQPSAISRQRFRSRTGPR